MHNEDVKNTAFAPIQNRSELLIEAFDMLLKLTPEQLAEVLDCTETIEQI